jgi:type I restriction enzyme S subunit
MSEWKQIRLGDRSQSFAGGTPDRDSSRYFGGSIPWVKSTEVNLGRIRKTEEFLTEEGLRSSSARWIPKNTVVVAMYGATAAQVAFLEIDATANQAVLAIVPEKGIDSLFLFYALTAAKQRLLFQAQGSGQPNLNKQIIDRLTIDLPSETEQRRIAEILTTVDEAMEQTEALVGKLEQMKAGLMHDLFTRGVTPDGHLRPTRQEAPHLYHQTPLGWLPKEWEVNRLGVILKKCGGYLQTGPFGSQLHAHEYQQEGVPVVMPQDINEGLISTDQIARIFEQRAEELSRHRMRVGDVVIARRGDLSRAAAITDSEEGWVCGTGCFLLRLGRGELRADFASALYRYDFIQRQIEGMAVGTTMRSLNNSVMERLYFPFCDHDEQTRIIARLTSNEALLLNSQTHLAKLRQQKQGLMQDLLTGRVRVKAPEPS